MQLVKKEGAYAIYQNADELHFVDFKSSGLYTSIFVFGLIAIITLLNVALQIFLGNGTVISALLVPGLICFFLWRKQKKKRHILEAKVKSENIVLVFDMINRKFYSGNRTLLGTHTECRFVYETQITSSSKKLLLSHPNGKLFIAKGNPFKGLNKPFKKELENYKLTNL